MELKGLEGKIKGKNKSKRNDHQTKHTLETKEGEGGEKQSEIKLKKLMNTEKQIIDEVLKQIDQEFHNISQPEVKATKSPKYTIQQPM